MPPDCAGWPEPASGSALSALPSVATGDRLSAATGLPVSGLPGCSAAAVGAPERGQVFDVGLVNEPAAVQHLGFQQVQCFVETGGDGEPWGVRKPGCTGTEQDLQGGRRDDNACLALRPAGPVGEGGGQRT